MSNPATSLQEVIVKVSQDYYRNSESCWSLFEALEKQINSRLEADYPSTESQQSVVQCLKFNRLIMEQRDVAKLIIELYASVTNKALSQPDDFDCLSTLFNESNVFSIFNLTNLSLRVDELRDKSSATLRALRDWLSSRLSRAEFLFLHRKISIELLHEAMEKVQIDGAQESVLQQISKLVEGFDQEIRLNNHPEIAKTLQFEVLLIKIRLAIYGNNYPQASQLILDQLPIYLEAKKKDLLNEQILLSGSEESPLKNASSRYRQLLLLQIKLFVLQGNFGEATKVMNSEAWDEYSKGIILHNLGNLLFRTRKFHTAYLHYEKALQSMITLRQSSFLKGKQVSKILCSMALVCMKQGNYVDAYHMLALAVFLHPALLQRELILLRLGECCVQHERDVQLEAQKHPALHRFPISLHTLPTTAKQRLILKFGQQDTYSSNTPLQTAAQEYEVFTRHIVPIPPESDRYSSFIESLLHCNLQSASVLFQRAYWTLLQKDERMKASNFRYGPTLKAVLMNLSYVYLRLKDYRLAVYYGNQHILLGGKKSAVVANIVAEGLFHLHRVEECDKVLRAAIQEQSMTIEADPSLPFTQHFLADQYMFSSTYLQCKAPGELEKIAVMSNALTLSLILKENLESTMIDQLLKQYPRLTPIWKCVLFSHYRRRNLEDIKTLIKAYTQKVK